MAGAYGLDLPSRDWPFCLAIIFSRDYSVDWKLICLAWPTGHYHCVMSGTSRGYTYPVSFTVPCLYEKRTDPDLSASASGNPLNDSNLFNEACYNLVYLELAACRLTVLPANMAQMTPNLRALNLNYNFLSDIAKPLTGLTRLRKLTVVGSRLKGSKPVLKMLHKMPEMELVDMR